MQPTPRQGISATVCMGALCMGASSYKASYEKFALSHTEEREFWGKCFASDS